MAFNYKHQCFIKSARCPKCGSRGYSVLNKKGAYIICTGCYRKTPTAMFEGAQSKDLSVKQDRITGKEALRLAIIAWRSGTLLDPASIDNERNLISYPDGTYAAGFITPQNNNFIERSIENDY